MWFLVHPERTSVPPWFTRNMVNLMAVRWMHQRTLIHLKLLSFWKIHRRLGAETRDQERAEYDVEGGS